MWTNPTFSREPVNERHGRWRPRFRTVEPRRKVVESCLPPLVGLGLNTPCWSGHCLGCGRTLISATWRDGHADVYCTRACREANE